MVAMGGVALLTALLAGLLTAPLLGSATEDAVREPLSRQADFLARVVPVTGPGFSRGPAAAFRAELSVGLVDTDGSTTGVAAVLTSAERAALTAGQPVSTDGVFEGESVVIEARALRDGGALVLATDAAFVDEASATLRRRVLLAITLGLLAALGVAWFVASRVGRPLTSTAEAARRLAAGERGITLAPTGTSEVDDVAAALTALDQALSRSEGRQRDFLLSVSHELRTPLTAVRGYAEALADGVVPPDEVGDVATTMRAEADRMAGYVEDLLALARLQADDFSLHVGAVDVGEVLAATHRAWSDRAGRAGLALVTHAVPVVLDTDGERLRQVLDALLDNAVRVCSPGDRVALEASATAAAVRVEVRDSGPGLTEDDARVAFVPGALHERYAGQPGQPGQPGQDRGGQGVGLALAARLVDRLGGTIAVSRAPEGGAAFVIDLPR